MKFDKITRQIVDSTASQSTSDEIPAIKSARKYTVNIDDRAWPVKFIVQKAYTTTIGCAKIVPEVMKYLGKDDKLDNKYA